MYKKIAADSNRPLRVCPQTISVRGRRFDAYYCPQTYIYELQLHLQAKVIGLCKDRWRGVMLIVKSPFKKVNY
jgi:hypothetical protein